MNATQEPTLQERVQVHRIIEYLRMHEGWPDEDEGILPLAMGLEVPGSQTGHQLLAEELARLRASLEVGVSEVAPSHQPEWLASQDRMPPVDPYGDLVGGRVTQSRLLYRRVHRTAESRGGGGQAIT